MSNFCGFHLQQENKAMNNYLDTELLGIVYKLNAYSIHVERRLDYFFFPKLVLTDLVYLK